MNKPIISRFCSVPGCLNEPDNAVLCYWHERTKMIGSALMAVATIIALFLALAAVLTLNGCAAPGPSKDRLRDLLGQCRDANRQRVKIIKEYDRETDDFFKRCRPVKGSNKFVCEGNFRVPEQEFGTINFGEAGN